MLRACDLRFAYAAGQPVLDGVSLEVAPGEIVGLTGASGGGKSTLGRILAGHQRAQAGIVAIDGGSKGGARPVQYLFQSPEFAVNPRWRIGRILNEAWTPDAAMLDAFGVSPRWRRSFPHELSGGQLQRVAILRALAPGIGYIVADEVTTMLDAVTQAQIWRALLATAEARGLGMLVLSHDLDLLDRVCQRRLVLADGRLTPEG